MKWCVSVWPSSTARRRHQTSPFQFGGEVTFWGGGCDTRTVLNNASPEEVKRHVTERLEIFSPGGGFVFNTIHNILPDVPPRNIVAMYEAIDSFNST